MYSTILNNIKGYGNPKFLDTESWKAESYWLKKQVNFNYSRYTK